MKLKILLALTLTFVCVIGTTQSFEFDWRNEFFEGLDDEGIEMTLEILASEYPVLGELLRATKIFYKNLQRSPKGLKLLDSFADVLDIATNREYNWTMVDLYLHHHEVPDVKTMFKTYMTIIFGDDEDKFSEAQLQYQLNTIKYLLKTDTKFQGLFVEQVLPLFESTEVKRFIDVLSDPTILVFFIDFTVDLIAIGSDFVIDTLLELKSNFLSEIDWQMGYGLGDYTEDLM